MNAKVALCVSIGLLCVEAASAGVILDAPGHVVAEGAATVARGGEPGTAFKIVDWRGRETGVSSVFDAEGVAAIPPLPTGYYNVIPLVTRHSSLVTGDGGETRLASIAVVPPPESFPAAEDGDFYAIDQGPIWQLARKEAFICPWNGGDQQLTEADILSLLGAKHARERVSPSVVMPKPDAFDGTFFMRGADLLRERGIKICENYVSVPVWTAPRKKMPTDLAALYAMCARLATEFGDRMEAWEFWNEPDIGPAPGPVWDVAAALKAAYFGYKAARPGIVVSSPPLCTSPGNWYMRTLFGSDVAKFIDVFNYHSYWPIAFYPERIGLLRKFLEEAGAGGRAMWLSEIGTNMEGPATDEGVMPEFKAHSPAQETLVAEFCPKALIALQMEGVARAYWFIMGAYSERNGTKDWGMQRRNGTVKPLFSSYSAILHELGKARILGEMEAPEGVKAFLFEQPDGSQSVAFWAVSPVDTVTGETTDVRDCGPVEFRVPAAATMSSVRLCDMCGAVSYVASGDGDVLALQASRFPQYVSGLKGLNAARLPVPPGTVGATPPAEDEDLSVIVRVELDENDWTITRNKSRAMPKGETGRLRVVVWNLGDAAKTGTVEVAGARLEGLPDAPFALGPRGTPPAEFDCTFMPFDDGGFDVDLVVRGVFDGKRGSRTFVPVWLQSRFFAGSEETPLAWKNLSSWRRNDSANKSSMTWDAEEGAIRFDWEWHGSAGHWAYPFYSLADDETLEGATVLSFEVKSAQDKVENDFNRAFVMLDGNEIGYLQPNGNWERRYVELPAEGLGKYREFRIGANPNGRKVSFWLRNVSVLRSNGSQ